MSFMAIHLLLFLVAVGAAVACPQGATLDSQNNKCYFVGTNCTKWKDARDSCLSMGGDLASIHSLEENRFINDLTKPYERVCKDSGVYIGLERNSVTDKFQWSDGTALDFTRWSPGFPIDDRYFCTEVGDYGILGDGFWTDCKVKKLPFVCTVPKTNPAPPSPKFSTTTAAIRCPLGTSLYQGRCYDFIFSPMNFTDAHNYCLQRGDLISIHNADENDWIATIVINKTFWTGLNNLNQQGFKWTDGSPNDYSNWYPDNGASCMNGPQDCMYGDAITQYWLLALVPRAGDLTFFF